MPLRAHHVPQHRIVHDRPLDTSTTLPFADLVYLFAEGLADAQETLDAHAASTPRSPLGSGVKPPSYRISETTLELELDVTVAARDGYPTDVTDATIGGPDDRMHSDGRALDLTADTQAGVDGRYFDREDTTNTRFLATWTPVPTPPRLRSDDYADSVGSGGTTAEELDGEGVEDGN